MAEQLRVMMAQINLLVGDIQGNTDRVLEAAREAIAREADVIAFPELTLTGYPPEDLLLRPSLNLRINKALQRIVDAELDIWVIVGHPHREEGRLFNALSVIRCGEVVATYHKQCLPNYEVFDERRYFSPGHSPCIVPIRDVPVALTICEDIWEEVPAAQASQAGARLMININASPFDKNKHRERLDLLGERGRRMDMPIVYVNLVGGQDELVFDGQSMVVDRDGDCRVLAPAFEAAMTPAAFAGTNEGHLALSDSEVREPQGTDADCYQALVTGLQDYVNKNGFAGIVLGLSGGIDSALTLAVAVDALGADRVEAIMMPFEYTSQLSVKLAEEQARALGVEYRTIPIERCYYSFMDALADEFRGRDVDVTEQNIQARCRGVLLMAISNKKGLLVVTTGNKSEMAVGYSTLYGDMAGGFDVLKDVYKTQVYRLAEYRNRLAARWGEIAPVPQAVLERPPSAELAPGQLDSDNLPAYARLDRILELYIEQDYSADAIVTRGFETPEVYRVLRLVDRNEYKRRQSPIGIRLTRRGFGRDRRYPITNAWELGE